MSLNKLARHYGIRIGVLIAVLLIILTLGPSIINYVPLASIPIKWLINALLLPLIIFMAIRLAGGFLSTRTGTLFKVLGSVLVSVIAPTVFAYLLLEGTLTTIPPLIHFNKLPGIFTAIFVIFVGAVLINYGRGFGEPVKSSLTYLGAAVVLYGVAGMGSIAYTPLGMPFLYASIGSALMGIVMLMSLHPALRPLVSDLPRIAKPIVALLFVVGFISMFAQIPQLKPYSGYLTMVSLILLAIIVVVIGYRLYSAFSRVAEKIAERIYEQHVRESPLLASSEDDVLVNAINEFIRRGRKEELIAYAAYALAHCDIDFTEVSTALRGLIDYEPPHYTGIWPWERRNVEGIAMKDAEARKQLVTELMKLITTCKVAKI
ncbi:hypothetical protein [Vulcanisaeta souniana]|nr:hypothetical protein [Vulcanisaeta souniana]BDR91268.1 hypothetical protein Vsou_03610 [Vulcanisaeta souniana JCM 11219]